MTTRQPAGPGKGTAARMPIRVGCYYLTYLAETAPFTAVAGMSALVAPEELGGRGLVYLPRYAPGNDPIFERSDQAIRDEFLEALGRLYPGLAEQAPLGFKVSRARRVFSIPTLGCSRRVPSERTSVAGLTVISSAQLVNATLNVNETVSLAEAAAGRLLERLGTRRP